MQNNLQQINISYAPNEDRLLLKAKTSDESELRIWLTRRYTSLLINVLVQQMDKAGGIIEIASSQNTLKQFKGGAFTHEYDQPSQQKFPLGESGVVGYRINAGQNADARFNLQLLPEAGEGLNFVLDKSMLFMFYNLLEQALSQAEWNLALPQAHREPIH
ncbi:MAG: hypothetical protein V4628_06430 [Pseudomonadota bacterium]